MCMVNTIYLFSFVETPRKFIITPHKFIIAIINLCGVSSKLNFFVKLQSQVLKFGQENLAI